MRLGSRPQGESQETQEKKHKIRDCHNHEGDQMSLVQSGESRECHDKKAIQLFSDNWTIYCSYSAVSNILYITT